MHIPRCLFYFLISFPSPLCSLVCIHCARQQRWKSFLIYALGEIRSMKVQKSTHPTRITNTKQGLAQTWQLLRCAFECLKYILHVYIWYFICIYLTFYTYILNIYLHVSIWYFILLYLIFICMYTFATACRSTSTGNTGPLLSEPQHPNATGIWIQALQSWNSWAIYLVQLAALIRTHLCIL